MNNIQDYVRNHVERGECKCGQCFDRGDKPDPEGHTIDMVFFTCIAFGEPTAEEFTKLTKENAERFADINPLDGKDHNYMELGAWIGDQGLAMMYMALGVHLGVFSLLSGNTLLGLPKGDPLVMQMAQAGLLSVMRKEAAHVA